MKLLATAVLAAALAVPAATAALKAPAANTLTGTVGPGFTIKLTQNGTPVKKLKAGKYTIKIADKAIDHNFHLKGPGVNKKTSVAREDQHDVERHPRRRASTPTCAIRTSPS